MNFSESGDAESFFNHRKLLYYFVNEFIELVEFLNDFLREQAVFKTFFLLKLKLSYFSRYILKAFKLIRTISNFHIFKNAWDVKKLKILSTFYFHHLRCRTTAINEA